MDLTLIENIRFTLGLVEESAVLVTDAEIQTQIDAYPADWRLAAAALADHLAARAINRPTSFAATGFMSVSWPDRAKTWMNLAKSLRAQVAADDAANATVDTIGVTQLKRAGVTVEEPEYSRPRKPWSWKE